MKISVVIPVFNAEKYIMSAINSILNQTYKNIEVICVDDCSTDNTFKLLKSIHNNRFNLYQNDENKGVIFTRSRAYSLCTGDFIANMDADDISNFDRLERQLKFLLDNSDIDVVGSSIDIMDVNEVIYDKWVPQLNNDDIKAALLFEMAIPNPTAMFRAKLKDKLFHENDFYSVEDYALYCDLAIQGYKFANIGEALLKYRIVESGMTQSNEKKAQFRDDVHKLVYKRNFSSLGMSELNLDIYKMVVSGEIINLEVLNEIGCHLKKIEELCPANYCNKYTMYRKISQLWSYSCLRASNHFLLPFVVFRKGFKFEYMLLKAYICTYIKNFGLIR